MKFSVLFLSISLVGSVSAKENNNDDPFGIAYFGIGDSKEQPYNDSEKALALGFIWTPKDKGFVLGLDIGMEGTLYHNGVPEQASSYNLLLGVPINYFKSYDMNISLMAGAIEKESSCADSYLGYYCYANSSPSVDYGFNYGAVFTVSYEYLTFGLRMSQASNQIILGFNF